MRLYLYICTCIYLHFVHTITLYVNIQLHKIIMILWAKKTIVILLKMFSEVINLIFNKSMSLLFCVFKRIYGRENNCKDSCSII